jgi:GNAT superfamily N-acetyltransferase
VAAEPLCDILAWDTEFFGRRIARVTVQRLSQAEMSWVLDWCRQNAIECLYFLADPNDMTTVRLAEDNDFRLVDIRLTLERPLADLALARAGLPGGVFRPAAPGDIPALRAIARVSHRDTRFRADSHFPPDLCDALYEEWIEQSCRGAADLVLVAEWRGQVAGYLSCHAAAAGGQIGLLGVGPAYRGQGLGRRLLLESLDWFVAQGLGRVTVVTQGANLGAQRLYQKCGFVTKQVQLWYHSWFHPAGEEHADSLQ